MQSMMNAFEGNSQIVPVQADANARPDQGAAGASSSIVPISTVIPPVEHTFTTRGPPQSMRVYQWRRGQHISRFAVRRAVKHFD